MRCRRVQRCMRCSRSQSPDTDCACRRAWVCSPLSRTSQAFEPCRKCSWTARAWAAATTRWLRCVTARCSSGSMLAASALPAAERDCRCDTLRGRTRCETLRSFAVQLSAKTTTISCPTRSQQEGERRSAQGCEHARRAMMSKEGRGRALLFSCVYRSRAALRTLCHQCRALRPFTWRHEAAFALRRRRPAAFHPSESAPWLQPA